MKRIQRQRTAGWRMPANAIYVGRPTIFGNPWSVRSALVSGLFKPEHAGQVCVDEFDAWLFGRKSPNNEDLGIWIVLKDRRAELLRRIEELRGHDLACWCRLDKPCHADVLIKYLEG